MKFKRFLILFILITFFPFSYNNQRVYALGGATTYGFGDALLDMGGAEAFVVAGGAYIGATFKKETDKLKDYVTQKCIEGGILASVYLCTDSSGNKYIGIKQDGLEKLSNIFSSVKSMSNVQVPTNSQNTTNNTRTNTMQPFMYNNMYMTPYQGLEVNHVYDSFMVNYGDILNLQVFDHNGEFFTASFTPTANCWVRLVQLNNYYSYVEYTYDTSNWSDKNLISYTWHHPDGTTSKYGAQIGADSTSVFDFGYQTKNNVVSVPTDGLDISGMTADKTTVNDGQIVAIPISGTVNDKGETVYTGVEGAVAGVMTGLTVKEISGSQTGTDTKAGELTQEAVREATREGTREGTRQGIADAVGNPFDVPTSDTPNLDFSPLYCDISKKFPFCVPFDFINFLSPFKASAQTPSFHINFDGNYFYGGGTFDFSFERFDTLVKVVRYFLLIAFVYYLIRKTRAWIGNGGGA